MFFKKMETKNRALAVNGTVVERDKYINGQSGGGLHIPENSVQIVVQLRVRWGGGALLTTNRQNSSIYNPLLYVAVTFELTVLFNNTIVLYYEFPCHPPPSSKKTIKHIAKFLARSLDVAAYFFF